MQSFARSKARKFAKDFPPHLTINALGFCDMGLKPFSSSLFAMLTMKFSMFSFFSAFKATTMRWEKYHKFIYYRFEGKNPPYERSRKKIRGWGRITRFKVSLCWRFKGRSCYCGPFLQQTRAEKMHKRWKSSGRSLMEKVAERHLRCNESKLSDNT